MNISKTEFIKTVADAAIKYYPKYGILPSLVVAQACKESGFGVHDCAGSYNFFGMKWTKTCGCDYIELSTKEWKDGKYITIKAKFRKYSSIEEGIKGYFDFISGYKRYSNLKNEKNSAKACQLIQQDGWATSPTYGTSLYNDYVLTYNLTKYDVIAITGQPAEPDEPAVPSGLDNYIVKRGDTLWSIAREYYGFGTKYKKLMEINHLTSSLIHPGDCLKVPKKGV